MADPSLKPLPSIAVMTEADLAEVFACLRECADDLEAELRARYGATVYEYASETRRFQRDMQPVLQARALIRRLETPA